MSVMKTNLRAILLYIVRNKLLHALFLSYTRVPQHLSVSLITIEMSAFPFAE